MSRGFLRRIFVLLTGQNQSIRTLHKGDLKIGKLEYEKNQKEKKMSHFKLIYHYIYLFMSLHTAKLGPECKSSQFLFARSCSWCGAQSPGPIFIAIFLSITAE